MTSGDQEKLRRHAPGEMEAAKRALSEARTLLLSKQSEGAISRGYYAIFHAARAVLNYYGSAPITHGGLYGEFARLLIKTNIIEKEFGDILRQAREERQSADYESAEKELIPDQETAKTVVLSAEEFIERMEKEIK